MHDSKERQPTTSVDVDSTSERLPEHLRPLFWDCNLDEVNWDDHHDFIVGRILSAGTFDALRWLRRKVGDEALRGWFNRRHGRELERKQIRFWELILRLSKADVDRWLAERSAVGWDDRTRP